VKPKIATLLAGLALLAPIQFFVLARLFPDSSSDNPPIFYPMPAIVLIGLVFGLKFAAVCTPALAFFLWNPGLLQGDATIPRRSYVLLAVAIAADALWFIADWRTGIEAQGPTYTYSVCAINLAWVTLLGAGFALSRKAPASFGRNLPLHWALFAWLGWSAFPFFGDFL